MYLYFPLRSNLYLLDVNGCCSPRAPPRGRTEQGFPLDAFQLVRIALIFFTDTPQTIPTYYPHYPFRLGPRNGKMTGPMGPKLGKRLLKTLLLGPVYLESYKLLNNRPQMRRQLKPINFWLVRQGWVNPYLPAAAANGVALTRSRQILGQSTYFFMFFCKLSQKDICHFHFLGIKKIGLYVSRICNNFFWFWSI